jgi:hypothetical protein
MAKSNIFCLLHPEMCRFSAKPKCLDDQALAPFFLTTLWLRAVAIQHLHKQKCNFKIPAVQKQYTCPFFQLIRGVLFFPFLPRFVPFSCFILLYFPFFKFLLSLFPFCVAILVYFRVIYFLFSHFFPSLSLYFLVTSLPSLILLPTLTSLFTFYFAFFVYFLCL